MIQAKVPVVLPTIDAEFIENLALATTDGNQSALMREIIADYLENPSRPNLRPSENVVQKQFLITQAQLKAVNALCRRYRNCHRSDIIREAIQRRRERGC